MASRWDFWFNHDKWARDYHEELRESFYKTIHYPNYSEIIRRIDLKSREKEAALRQKQYEECLEKMTPLNQQAETYLTTEYPEWIRSLLGEGYTVEYTFINEGSILQKQYGYNTYFTLDIRSEWLKQFTQKLKPGWVSFNPLDRYRIEGSFSSKDSLEDIKNQIKEETSCKILHNLYDRLWEENLVFDSYELNLLLSTYIQNRNYNALEILFRKVNTLSPEQRNEIKSLFAEVTDQQS